MVGQVCVRFEQCAGQRDSDGGYIHIFGDADDEGRGGGRRRELEVVGKYGAYGHGGLEEAGA